MSHELTTEKSPLSSWRFAGAWMTAIIALFMIVNFARAFFNPVGFALYVGLPIGGEALAGFVHLYAFRALFLGLFAGFLLWRQDAGTLKWFALIAIVMPLGDAYLTIQAGAGPSTIARHIGIALFLGLTSFMLSRWERRITTD
jgi:hypothetical protein